MGIGAQGGETVNTNAVLARGDGPDQINRDDIVDATRVQPRNEPMTAPQQPDVAFGATWRRRNQTVAIGQARDGE